MNTQDISNIRSAKHPFLYCYGVSDHLQYEIEEEGGFPCYSGPVTPAVGYYSLLAKRMVSNATSNEAVERALKAFEEKYGKQRQIEVEWWRANENYAIQHADAFVLGFTDKIDDKKLKQLIDIITKENRPAVILEHDFDAPLFLDKLSIFKISYRELGKEKFMGELYRFLREGIPWKAIPSEVEPSPKELEDFRIEVSSFEEPESPAPAAAIIAADFSRENPKVAQSIAIYQLWYSIIGLLLGVLCVLGGIILLLNGIAGKTSWTANILGSETNITDAAPGTILFVVGLFIVIVTRFRYKIGK